MDPYQPEKILLNGKNRSLCGRCDGQNKNEIPPYERYCMNCIALDFIPVWYVWTKKLAQSIKPQKNNPIETITCRWLLLVLKPFMKKSN
jgi:hypothetical protein